MCLLKFVKSYPFTGSYSLPSFLTNCTSRMISGPLPNPRWGEEKLEYKPGTFGPDIPFRLIASLAARSLMRSPPPFAPGKLGKGVFISSWPLEKLSSLSGDVKKWKLSWSLCVCVGENHIWCLSHQLKHPPTFFSSCFCFLISALRSLALRSLALPAPPAFLIAASRSARPPSSTPAGGARLLLSPKRWSLCHIQSLQSPIYGFWDQIPCSSHDVMISKQRMFSCLSNTHLNQPRVQQVEVEEHLMVVAGAGEEAAVLPLEVEEEEPGEVEAVEELLGAGVVERHHRHLQHQRGLTEYQPEGKQAKCIVISPFLLSFVSVVSFCRWNSCGATLEKHFKLCPATLKMRILEQHNAHHPSFPCLSQRKEHQEVNITKVQWMPNVVAPIYSQR